jgi:hypothetical protein
MLKSLGLMALTFDPQAAEQGESVVQRHRSSLAPFRIVVDILAILLGSAGRKPMLPVPGNFCAARPKRGQIGSVSFNGRGGVVAGETSAAVAISPQSSTGSTPSARDMKSYSTTRPGADRARIRKRSSEAMATQCAEPAKAPDISRAVSLCTAERDSRWSKPDSALLT